MIKLKRKLLTAVTAAAILVCMLTGVAFADGTEKTAAIPTSDKDYANWGVDGIANYYTSSFIGGSRGRYEGFFMRGTNEQAVEQFKTFLDSRNVSLTDSLKSGQWTNHPAIFVSIFPEGQYTSHVGPSYASDKGTLMYNAFYSNYEKMLGQIYPDKGKSYERFISTNMVSAKIEAEVVLYKMISGSWVSTQSKIVTLGTKGEQSRMVFNGVLFYDLEGNADYKVTVEVRINEYTERSNDGSLHKGGPVKFVQPEYAFKTYSFKEQIYEDNALVEFRAGFLQRGGDGHFHIVDDSVADKVSHNVPPSLVSVYTSWNGGLSSANPMAIINDQSTILTKPLESEDARKISTAYKLLRLLAITLCIFGMMGAIVRVANPSVSGFALFRIREALSGWVLLLFVIGLATMILSVLVKALFF